MRARGVVRAAALVGFLSVCSPGRAGGYALLEDGHGHPLYWDDMPVSYYLVSGNVPGGAAGEDAVHRAFRTWGDASTNVSYRFAGYLSEGRQAFDGRNVVYWIRQGWPFDRSLVAVTFHYYDTRDGHLLDADIAFNAERYSWSVGGSGYDIENAAAHEVGHFNGLAHSSDPEATMYARTDAGETEKRTLAPDDVAGLEALYGGTRPGSSAGVAGAGAAAGGGGGCRIARKSPQPAAAEIAWLLALLACPAAAGRGPRRRTPRLRSGRRPGEEMPERPVFDRV